MTQRMGEGRALGMIWDVVRALAHASRRGIVHGDLKPSNFLLSASGAVKLCDFGLARPFDAESEKRRRGTAEEEERRGTAAYSAPERFRAGAVPTFKSDVYALGVSFFQMVTGRLPFIGRSVASLRRAHESEARPDPRPLAPGLRSGTALFIGRLMARDPAGRYASYEELIADLSVLSP